MAGAVAGKVETFSKQYHELLRNSIIYIFLQMCEYDCEGVLTSYANNGLNRMQYSCTWG